MRRFLIYIAALLVLGFGYSRRPGEYERNKEHASDTIPKARKAAAVRVPVDTAAEDSLRHAPATVDTLSGADAALDSLAMLRRSIMDGRQGLGSDSVGPKGSLSRINRNKVDIETAVSFQARDSMVMRGQNSAFMYGAGNVKYGEMNLNSGKIRVSLDSATVYAEGLPDSAGNLKEKPIFADKGGQYESKTMSYNFKTERGYITDVVTEQGEGYLLGGAAKKMEDGSFFVKDGRYTTCEDHDHPHFYFQITRGKVRPKKNVVTGPGYLVLADVPLPLALPFGYFPFSEKYSSGIIFPSFGEDYNKGFYLQGGGYYFAISDYVDLALRGEIFTRGSWGITAHSTYTKRYRYSGNVDLSYLITVTGDKGSPDYVKEKNFRVLWSHQQDTKANPNMNFSASVNFATTGYSRNDVNSYYNQAFTENTKSSTVNFSYRFPGTKWSISTTANIAQRSQDSTLAVTFPSLTVTLSQTAPFKRKRAVGGERWYEKIKISYSGMLSNQLTAKQNEFFHKNLIKDWRNGMSHRVPISATFSVFKYINVTPNIELNDRMYTQKIRRAWDPNSSAEVRDTLSGFYNIFDFNAAVSIDTKLYGFFKPMKFLGDKVQMIRHVLTPSITISGHPNFASRFWGAYDSYTYVDAQGVPRTNQYSYFENGLYGSPSSGRAGIVSLQLANNLEMKVKSDKDSTGVKKVSLIENLTIGQSYNFAADSLRFSNIDTSIMLRLVKNFNLSLRATWDPYMYGVNEYGSPTRLDKLRISHGKGIARLSSTGTSFSYTFNNDTFRRKSDREEDGRRNREGDEEDGENDDSEFGRGALLRPSRTEKRKDDKQTGSDADGYAKWAFPWSLTLNYSVNYAYGAFDYDKLEYKGKWTQNLSLNATVRPTPNWNFSLSASYNFDAHKIAYMNCSISRDLHCFTMSCSFVPVGPFKSYNFHIAVKSSILSDLKYDKRSSTSNGVQWY